METQHFILLSVILGTVVCILGGLTVLFWNAFQRAQRRDHGSLSGAVQENFIQWNETGVLTLLKHKALGRISDAFSGIFSFNTESSLALSVIDPVDGTAFEKGETIIRCACGTNYHEHSWQWLSEKVDARCVNCKRPAVQERLLA